MRLESEPSDHSLWVWGAGLRTWEPAPATSPWGSAKRMGAQVLNVTGLAKVSGPVSLFMRPRDGFPTPVTGHHTELQTSAPAPATYTPPANT